MILLYSNGNSKHIFGNENDVQQKMALKAVLNCFQINKMMTEGALQKDLETQ